MTTRAKKRWNLWLAWNYESQQKHLDELSRQGVHLVKPGLFRGSFDSNPNVRFTYRIDYQPKVRKNEQLNDYLSLYEDTGWEFVGEIQGWYHFRRPFASDQAQYELYTDTDSLRQHYRRIQQILALVLLVEFIVLAVNINNYAILGPRNHYVMYVYVLLFVLLAGVSGLLAFGCVVLHKKIGRLPQS